MREIKFRAWEPLNKEMHYMDYCLFEYREQRNKFAMPKGNQQLQFAYCHMNLDSLVVMQYTGLEDKNGKEIYEGDIVTIPGQYPYFDCDTPNYVAEVEWIFAGFQTVLHCINGEKRGISEGINEPLEDGDYFEVIGNIYENPELLK